MIWKHFFQYLKIISALITIMIYNYEIILCSYHMVVSFSPTLTHHY
jgi:hypothetical protein